MKWNIVADSSIDLFSTELEYENIHFSTVPFTISIGETHFIDDDRLDIDKLVAKMKSTDDSSHTSCPSSGAWYEKFKEEGHIIAITLTSGLSGSYNSACAARNMILEEYPDKKITIIDSLSVGPEMVLLVRKICTLIELGKNFEEVVSQSQLYMTQTQVMFALSSFDNLVRNGRIHKLTGFVANKFGFLGVGSANETGTIEMRGIVRGKKKAINIILNGLKQKEEQLKSVVISHCQNPEFAKRLKNEIQNIWSDSEVTIIPTRGLCSFYAEQKGLIIGY
jgi:DegV family protein with EDD domain